MRLPWTLLFLLLTTPAFGQWSYRFVPQGPPQIYRRYYATPIRDFLFGRYRIYQPGYWQPGYWRWTPCDPGYYQRGPIQGKYSGEGWNRWHTKTIRP